MNNYEALRKLSAIVLYIQTKKYSSPLILTNEDE